MERIATKKELAIQIYNETLYKLVSMEIDILNIQKATFIQTKEDQKNIPEMMKTVGQLKGRIPQLERLLRSCKDKIEEYEKEELKDKEKES